jgi:hypothetical protein
MELVIFYNSEVNEKTGKFKNSQKIQCHHKCEASPKDIASTVYPNWYGISINGGVLVRNPQHQAGI